MSLQEDGMVACSWDEVDRMSATAEPSRRRSQMKGLRLDYIAGCCSDFSRVSTF